MSNILFSNTAQIDIQGPAALNFVALNQDSVEFEIIGLTDPVVRLIDKRPDVKQAMADALRTGQVDILAAHFNKPARVRMYSPKDGKLTVHLEKTKAKKLQHMLWVAIGIKGDIPYFKQTVRLQIERLEEDSFALFYIFKKPADTSNGLI